MLPTGRSPRAEALASPFSRRRSSRSSLEHKNVVSWRVPNSPKPQSASSNSISKKTQTASPRSSTREPSPAVSEVVDDLKSLSAVSDMNLDDKASEVIDFQDRCWQMLHNNIEHAIDELYDLCEEEEDVNRCLEAIDMFNQTTRDFTKLIEKIQAQRYYNIANPSSLSWEIRKPRRHSNTTSPGSSHVSKASSNRSHHKAVNNDSSQTSDDKSTSMTQEQAINETIATINRLDEKFQSFSPKLRPEAKPFIPKPPIEPIIITSMDSVASEETKPEVKAVETVPAEKVVMAEAHQALPIPTISISPTITPTAMGQLKGKGASKPSSHQNSPKRPTSKTTPKSESGRQLRSPFRVIPPSNRHVTISSPKASSIASITPGEIEVDFDVQQEVALASEEVWAEAEAWVEAEAALEDAAWDQLEKDSPSTSLTDRYQSSHDHDEEIERLVVNKAFEDVQLSLDEETVRTPSPRIPMHDVDETVRVRVRQGLWTPPPQRSSLLRMASSAYPMSGSQSVQPPGSAGSGRFLHKKLSSPDRKKSSPSDLKRR
jgi:hypothetical protein